jgi:hypothetical protein
MRPCTGGDDNGIGLESGNEISVNSCVPPYLHTRQFHFARQVGDDAAEFGPAREELSDKRLATKLG